MQALIAIRDGIRQERLRLALESERSDCTAFSVTDGRAAIEAIFSVTPDILLLDQVLPRLDGLSVLSLLRESSMPCPPRVVFRTSPNREMFPDSSYLGADILLSCDAKEKDFLLGIQRAETPLQGALARLQWDYRAGLCQAFLQELGMPPRLKGCKYLAYLLNLAVPAPALLDALTVRLYPASASYFSTAPAAVERCIRHAIETTWNRGSMEALEKFFGLSIDPERGKPTNREFLAMAAQHLRNRMQSSLHGNYNQEKPSADPFCTLQA